MMLAARGNADSLPLRSDGLGACANVGQLNWADIDRRRGWCTLETACFAGTAVFLSALEHLRAGNARTPEPR
jgi:hypothetical protein